MILEVESLFITLADCFTCILHKDTLQTSLKWIDLIRLYDEVSQATSLQLNYGCLYCNMYPTKN